jgi:predicted DCC family thiol-disulfide oxidoreductase YuxK
MQANLFYRLAGFLMKTPPTSWLAKIAYHWIAKNRHRLPGGTKQCSIQDNYLAEN